jgi:transposase
MVKGRPGVAPQTAKRDKFTRLIAEGLSIAEAVRRVGIHYRTGRRWLRGRRRAGRHQGPTARHSSQQT